MLPIGHLLKSEVRALARELSVPTPIIERTPSAGLWIGQTDEEEMGFTYADLERYLEEGPQGVSPALAMKIERLTRSSSTNARFRRCRATDEERLFVVCACLCVLGGYTSANLYPTPQTVSR